MTIDNEKIKNALDDFENDNFIDSKDILKGEIQGAISDYFTNKLELKNNLGSESETEIDNNGVEDDPEN